MREHFLKELKLLDQELTEMGAMIERSITLAVAALIKKDPEMAKEAISYDQDIDNKEKQIESHCLHLLLQQQPVASDLRLVSAAIKMITDMERIGDHAQDISEITLLIYQKEYDSCVCKMRELATATIKMVNDSIIAFTSRDQKLAKEVQQYDDVVDRIFVELKSDLIKLVQNKSKESEVAIDLVMIAKYFERIGDHAVNIAEWVEFSQTGNYKGSKMM